MKFRGDNSIDRSVFPKELLADPAEVERFVISDEDLAESTRLLAAILEDYGVEGEIVSVHPGPVVTRYELEPGPGLKASRVIGLADDIARSMCALSARVSTVPGSNTIGIELPNEKREMINFRELLSTRDFTDCSYKLPLVLGKDIGGDPIVVDLAKMPHLLIAGTTGSGKSVAINTMILSLLYKLTPDECRLIMIDPKMLELSVYDGIPHLLSPVVTDPRKAVVALNWTVGEMEERYRKMSKMGVRNIDGYNSRVKEALAKDEMFSRTVQTAFDDESGEPIFETEEFQPESMPYIVVVVDEMAALMMVAGKEIEACTQRLAQMARASGIHLIMATQRPSVDVVTGTIKANFPTRISFQVTSKIDSRTILGEMGAEQLLGMGDMLYMTGGSKITRSHGPYVSDEEVIGIITHLKTFRPPSYVNGLLEVPEEGKVNNIGTLLGLGGNSDGENELYNQAVALVANDRKCSTSYIQRKLGIGYNNAARLVEQMEHEGLVSAANHVGKREILISRSSTTEKNRPESSQNVEHTTDQKNQPHMTELTAKPDRIVIPEFLRRHVKAHAQEELYAADTEKVNEAPPPVKIAASGHSKLAPVQATSDQIHEFLKHLRSVHFGMIVLCLLIWFAATQTERTDISSAKRQYTALSEAASRSISSDKLMSPFNKTYLQRYSTVDSDFKLIEDFTLNSERDVIVQGDFYIASHTNWLVAGYNSCGDESSLGADWTTDGHQIIMSHANSSIANFIDLWDNLGRTKILSPVEIGEEVVLHRSHDQQEIRAKRSDAMAFETGSPVLIPCTIGESFGFRVLVADLNAKDQGYEIQYLKEFDTISEHQGFNPRTMNLRSKLSQLSDGMPSGVAPRGFAYEFPEFNAITAENRNMNFDEIGVTLDLLARLDPPSIGFSGISVPFRDFVSLGSIIILLFQAYFLFHIVQFSKIFRTAEALHFPWIATYPNTLARIATVASSCVVPVSIIAYLAWIGYTEMNSHHDFSYVFRNQQLIVFDLFGLMASVCLSISTYFYCDFSFKCKVLGSGLITRI